MPFDTYPAKSGVITQKPASALEVEGIVGGEPLDVELSTVPALAAQGVAGGEPLDVELSTVPTIAVTLTSDIASFTFAPAAGAVNVCDVVVTAKDLLGATKAGIATYDIFLSDGGTGFGLTGTTASGTVTAKSLSGGVLFTYTSKKHLLVQSLATGIFTLEITDTANTGFYVVARLPSGLLSVSAQLVTGDYG